MTEAIVCSDLKKPIVVKNHSVSNSSCLGEISNVPAPLAREGMILRAIGILAIGSFLSILVSFNDLKFKPEFRPIDQIGSNVKAMIKSSY